jgi:hypothetical protein
MASARIDAAAVYRAAEAKWAEAETERAAAKDAWFTQRLREPVQRWALWWKRDHYRTQAELEAEYVHTSEIQWVSEEYENESKFWRTQGKAERLRDIAKAALTRGTLHGGIGYGSGDGYVTLDADEVRFLGLEGK